MSVIYRDEEVIGEGEILKWKSREFYFEHCEVDKLGRRSRGDSNLETKGKVGVHWHIGGL